MAITVTDYQPDEAMAIDTYINSVSPNTNYGTSDSMIIGGTYSAPNTFYYRPIIGFNWIFEKYLNRKIKFASDLKLSIYSFGGASKYHNFYFVKRDFVESEATWNNWKSGNAWQSAGGGGAADVDTPPQGLGSSNVTWSVGWWDLLIPGGFLEQCRAGKYFGLLFIGWEGTGSDTTSTIASSSYATTANRPKYTFSYEPYHKIFPVKSSLGQVK